MDNGVSATSNLAQVSIKAAKGPVRQQAMTGYEASRDVKNRASVTKPMNDPEFKNAMLRLDRALETDATFRLDVPRGYYLNVTV